MTLGQRLIEFRKSKNLSQEGLAEKLNVTRQTISKWETDQSTPDFDKIVPLCEVFGITTDELFNGTKENMEKIVPIKNQENSKKRTIGLVIGIFLYFVAIVWVMITIPVLLMNPIVASSIFLLICGVATCILIYTRTVYKKEKIKVEKEESKLYKQISGIVSTIILIIYLLISFITFRWDITWIIWIIYALIMKIIKLIMSLRGDEDEK